MFFRKKVNKEVEPKEVSNEEAIACLKIIKEQLISEIDRVDLKIFELENPAINDGVTVSFRNDSSGQVIQGEGTIVSHDYYESDNQIRLIYSVDFNGELIDVDSKFIVNKID